MAAAYGDGAAVDKGDGLGVADEGQLMGGGESAEVDEIAADGGFSESVQCVGRLDEDEDGWGVA